LGCLNPCACTRVQTWSHGRADAPGRIRTEAARRPLYYAIQLHRGGSPVGLDLHYAKEGQSTTSLSLSLSLFLYTLYYPQTSLFAGTHIYAMF